MILFKNFIIRSLPQDSSEKKKNIEWARENRNTLEKYEGKWIAVYQKRVLASGSIGDEVKKQAYQKLGKETSDLYLRFLEYSNCIY